MRKLLTIPAVLILCLILLLSAASCGREEAQKADFYLYFLRQDGEGLYPVPAVFSEDMQGETLIFAIWSHLCEISENENYIPAIPDEITLKSISAENDSNLMLNLNSAYYEMDTASQTLMRAALVRTYTQLPEFISVEILVDAQPVSLKDGTFIGPEYQNSFVDVFDSGLNEYSETALNLYFADPGEMLLVPRNTSIIYKNNYPLEQYVLLRLIEGPEAGSEDLATLPPNVQLLSVNTKNGICHVNFSNEFLEAEYQVPPEICIYSIVNSLTEVSGVSSVQISVNGSSALSFGNEISLEQPFQRNLDLVLSENTKESGEEP